MSTYRYQWNCFTRLLAMAATRGYTVKFVPVPERDDAVLPRCFEVLELCPAPVAADTPPVCWHSEPGIPWNCIMEAYDYLVSCAK